MHPDRALTELLLSLFSADELRRWISYDIPDGEALTKELPGATAPPVQVASAAVGLFRGRGLLAEASFWDAMFAARPRRKDDIGRVKIAIEAESGANLGAPSPSPSQGVLTVLLVSASPTSQVRVRVDREFREIIGRMKATRHRDRFRFEQLQAARFEDLRTALQEHQPHILHISCHGDSEGALVFEGDPDGSGKIPKRKFKKLIRALSDNLQLVVLNACESAQIARELPPDIGLAIGMSDEVADADAIDFSVAFYESLGFGKSVEKALEVAVAGLGEVDDEIPQLFPPAADDPQKRRSAPLLRT